MGRDAILDRAFECGDRPDPVPGLGSDVTRQLFDALAVAVFVGGYRVALCQKDFEFPTSNHVERKMIY